MQKVQPDYKLVADISNNNGHVDMTGWKAVGIQGVYIKASEGATFKDGYMVENVQKAHDVGIPAGLYHFARPSKNSATVEAQNFLAQYAKVKTDLDPVLDLEDDGLQNSGAETTNMLLAWMNEFADAVYKAIGKQVILYTAQWYASKYGFMPAYVALQRFRLWTAWYPSDVANVANLSPTNYGGWREYTMWQFRSDGALPGVAGNVDLNYAVSLEALGYAPAPSVAPTWTPEQEDAAKVVRNFQTLHALSATATERDAIHVAADAVRAKYKLEGLV